MQTKVLAKINNVTIPMIDGADKMIPIKPICDALGIDHKTQIDKIRSDEFLSSVSRVTLLEGAERECQMYCIPLEYVFGWLFTINPKKVKPEARKAVAKYRIECYKTLFRQFVEQYDYINDKQRMIEQKEESVRTMENEYRVSKDKLTRAKHDLEQARDYSFEVWVADHRQLKIDFKY